VPLDGGPTTFVLVAPANAIIGSIGMYLK
jgi:hypothetical protein